MAENPDEGCVLSNLCAICHINPPKYRCPRCSIRTCSLPCSRRHKLWSQCSGVSDPAAYLRRSELATEASFDRDFNFITRIERSLERAEWDAENRGIRLDRDHIDTEDNAETKSGDEKRNLKRKRRIPKNGGLAKGEHAFLREAERAGVRVVRAPRGMSRNKQNASRWLPKSKCLNWTVEWILPPGEKATRNYAETTTISQAFDRLIPPSKQQSAEITKSSRQHTGPRKEDLSTGCVVARALPMSIDSEQPSFSSTLPQDTENDVTTSTANSHNTEEKHAGKCDGPEPMVSAASCTSNAANNETKTEGEEEATSPFDIRIAPYRERFFYLHRPSTATKQPVLIPLSPTMTLSVALKDHTVLEFPTVYVLHDSPETLLRDSSRDSTEFLLEEEYMRACQPADELMLSALETEDDACANNDNPPAAIAAEDLETVDEKQVMEVLKHDMLDQGHDAAA